MLTKPNMVVFLMPNGNVFEIMVPQIYASQPELEKMEYPKAEFLVDVVHQSFQEMETIGIVFVDRVYVAEKHAWTKFTLLMDIFTN